ncbi:shikimate dehydrogenase [Gemmatimonadota bacterium]
MPASIYLIGDPVAHSLSPAFQNAALRALNIDMVYKAVRVEHSELGGFLESLRGSGAVGANITVPHKVAAVGQMDSLERSASVTGAVNTVVVRDGRLRGANTDVAGFLAALAEFAPDGLVRPSALVLGAGGAARAVIWALVSIQAVKEITVSSRDPEKVQLILNMVRAGLGRTGGSMPGFTTVQQPETVGPATRERLGLVVNATPLGMGQHVEESPLSGFEGMPPDALVFDLTYGNPENRLLREARQHGLATCNGLSMLLHQGAASFNQWTGREAPLEVMRDALAEYIGPQSHPPEGQHR